MTKAKVGGLATAVLVGLMALPTFAQNAPGGAGGGNNGNTGQQGGGGGGGGGRGNFDPAQFRQRMLDRMKDQLGASDDEFKALQPAIEKVTTLQREMNAGRMGGFGGRGGQGGQGGRGNRNNGNGGNNTTTANPAGGAPAGAAPAGNGPADGNTSAIATKTKELQDMLENKDAKPEEIKAKLDDLRAAKGKTKDELTKAQSDLRELLSQRQEAVMVTLGVLD